MKIFLGVIVIFKTITPLNFSKNVISDYHTFKSSQLAAQQLATVEVINAPARVLARVSAAERGR